MINNIIFDFDGVLVDSEMLVAKSFSKYMNSLGYDFQEQNFAQFAGLKTFEVISILSKKFSIRNKKKFNEDIMNIVTTIYLKVIYDNNLKKNETLIIEDSSVGVQAGVAADIKVIGLTAGGHWYKERINNELFDAGAVEVIDNFDKLPYFIEKF